MPKYKRIASYAAAAALAAADPDGPARRLKDGSIAFVDPDGRKLVTFYADGRIRISTWGTNDQSTSERINCCLPHPYRVQKVDRGIAVELIDARRPDAPVARFLSSFVFTPEPSQNAEAA